MNSKCFDQTKFERQFYFDQFHFYEHTIKALKKKGVLVEMFNTNNLKFNPTLSQYYVMESRFPYKYFALRNMFLSTGFFQRNEGSTNHLFIKKEFTDEFRETIVNNLPSLNKTGRKISLAQLKRSLQNKEDAGKRAELFALEFEYRRLYGHPELDKVEIISDGHTNAEYDIESYDDVDSIVFDRFIEVKSYDREVSLFWSRNEVEKARELRGKYYLYLVDRSRIQESDYKPQQLQDPYKKVFENEIWKKETENWKITLEN